MRTLLFIFLVVFSTASLAQERCHYEHGHYGHHYQHAHYGYGGDITVYYVPRKVYERDVYRAGGLRYWPYRTRYNYDYYRPSYNRTWWW